MTPKSADKKGQKKQGAEKSEKKAQTTKLEVVETTPTPEAKPATTTRKPREPKAAPKPVEPTPEPTPEPAGEGEEICVFAFRLTRSERDLIHATAGSAKASKFVKAVVLAAARGDLEHVQRIIDEAAKASR